MARVGVVRNAQGKIESLLSVSAAKERGITEFKDNQDPECLLFLNPPALGTVAFVDLEIAQSPFKRGLLATLEERMTPKVTVAELTADIKRLA